jgi:hypothetical protein
MCGRKKFWSNLGRYCEMLLRWLRKIRESIRVTEYRDEIWTVMSRTGDQSPSLFFVRYVLRLLIKFQCYLWTTVCVCVCACVCVWVRARFRARIYAYLHTFKSLLNCKLIPTKYFRKIVLIYIWGWNRGSIGEIKCAYRILIWKPEEQKTLGRPTLRWKANIKR